MKHLLREFILLSINAKGIIDPVDAKETAQFLNRVLRQFVILQNQVSVEVKDAQPDFDLIRRNPKEFYQFNENTRKLIYQAWFAYLTEHERPKYWFCAQKLNMLIASITAHKTISPDIDYFVVISDQVKLLTAT